MEQLSSHNFKEVYQWLGIDLSRLGCVMLDVENIISGVTIDPYYANDPSRFWIDGNVMQKTPHLTLLYGLINEAKNYEKHIEKLLEGWEMDSISIKDIGYFDSPYEDEEYYCIVAHIEVTKELLEGHQRMEFLPHVNTFTGYKPHVTLAYIKKDPAVRDDVISFLKKELVGQKLKVKQLNYGGNKN